jgi:ABC-type lipoprotein export system ATPase subunit
MNTISLKVNNLVIGYKVTRKETKVVAENIRSTLRAGELVCLLGPNGAGKSTLMRTMAGMQKPLGGEVLLDGANIHDLPPRELAKRLSVVLTERISAGAMTAYSLVALGRYPHTNWAGALNNKDHEVIQWALQITGTGDFADRPIGELSDGERQRVMIARALAQEPQWSRALQGNPYLLVRKMLDIRNFSLRSHLGRWFVIDPDWFSLVEAREWGLLYEKANRRSHSASLQEISKRNFQKLRGAVARYRAVNICGSGPSIQQLVDDPPQDALNIICNTAVQSPHLVEQLKPAVVAFANGVFFGPSEFARGIISGAERCVRDYNAVIVTAG